MTTFGGMAPTLTDKLRNTNPPLVFFVTWSRPWRDSIWHPALLIVSKSYRLTICMRPWILVLRCIPMGLLYPIFLRRKTDWGYFSQLLIISAARSYPLRHFIIRDSNRWWSSGIQQPQLGRIMFCSVKSRFLSHVSSPWVKVPRFQTRPIKSPPRRGISEEAVVNHFLTSRSLTYHILQPHTSPHGFWPYLTARRLFTFRAPGGYH